MSYETKVTRCIRGGLEALTVIDLGLGDRRAMRVTTFKYPSGIVCSGHVVKIAEDGRGFSWMMYTDYDTKTLAISERGARGTDANIRRIHAGGLAMIEGHIAAARKQYAPKTEDAPSTHEKLTLTGSNRAADANPDQAGLL